MYSHPQHGRSAAVESLRKQAGQLLKRMRESKGMTQRELAERVGFDYYTFVAQIESGRGRVPPERYGAYARALEMPSRDFVRTILKFYDPVTYSHLFGEEGEAGPMGSDTWKSSS